MNEKITVKLDEWDALMERTPMELSRQGQRSLIAALRRAMEYIELAIDADESCEPDDAKRDIERILGV